MVELFVFTSNTITNIWAGIGAGIWAVSKLIADNISTIGKVERMRIGSLGLLYCSETQSLTTPFIVLSRPDPNEIVNNIWSEEWALPFKIHPLGTPQKQIHKDQLEDLLPSLKNGNKPWNHVFHFQPLTAFAPSVISDEDWEILLELLV